MIIHMPSGYMQMALISPETGETRTFSPDDVRKATMDPVHAHVTLEMYDENGQAGGPTIVINSIDIVTYKILSSLGVDGAFEVEFLS